MSPDAIVYGMLCLIGLMVGGFVVVGIYQKAEPDDPCRRASLSRWQSSSSFCVDPRNGALYAPQFVRKQ